MGPGLLCPGTVEQYRLLGAMRASTFKGPTSGGASTSEGSWTCSRHHQSCIETAQFVKKIDIEHFEGTNLSLVMFEDGFEGAAIT